MDSVKLRVVRVEPGSKYSEYFRRGDSFDALDFLTWLDASEVPLGMVVWLRGHYYKVVQGNEKYAMRQCDQRGEHLTGEILYSSRLTNQLNFGDDPWGTTPFHVLLEFYKAELAQKQVSYEYVARAVNRSRSAVSYHVGRLVESGYMTRFDTPRLTERGRAFVQKILREHELLQEHTTPCSEPNTSGERRNN